MTGISDRLMPFPPQETHLVMKASGRSETNRLPPQAGQDERLTRHLWTGLASFRYVRAACQRGPEIGLVSFNLPNREENRDHNSPSGLAHCRAGL